MIRHCEFRATNGFFLNKRYELLDEAEESFTSAYALECRCRQENAGRSCEAGTVQSVGSGCEEKR